LLTLPGRGEPLALCLVRSLRRLPAACCGLAAVLLGCSLYEAQRPVTLLLPEPPGHWRECFGELPWLVTLPGSGSVAEIRTEPGRPTTVLLPKLQHQPVLAFPVLPDGERLLPAAGVFPLDLAADGSALLLRWEQGPAGELLLRLLRQGLDVETLNVSRLCREIQARFALDPWDLDLDAAAAGLVSDSFRVTDLRPLPVGTLVLEVGPGRWFLESPFFRPVTLPAEAGTPGVPILEAASSLGLTLLNVPVGFHRLFETESGWVADLWVEAEGVLWFPGRPAAAAEGPPPRLSGCPGGRIGRLDTPAAGTTQ